MKIYTSYFANGKKLANANIKVVGIALRPPTWYNGVSLLQVAPTPSILYAQNQSDETYTRRYKAEVLSRIDPHKFVSDLYAVSQGKDVALCCFEKPEDFCHRHILAEWLTEKTGIEIEEFGVSKNPQAVQGDLFAGMF